MLHGGQKKKKKNAHSTNFIKHYPLLPSECILFLWLCLYLAQGLADNWYPDSRWLNWTHAICSIFHHHCYCLLFPSSFKLPVISFDANQWSFLCVHLSWPLSWPLLNLCLVLTHPMCSQKAVLSTQHREQFHPQFLGKQLQNSAWNLNHWDIYTYKPAFFFKIQMHPRWLRRVKIHTSLLIILIYLFFSYSLPVSCTWRNEGILVWTSLEGWKGHLEGEGIISSRPKSRLRIRKVNLIFKVIQLSTLPVHIYTRFPFQPPIRTPGFSPLMASKGRGSFQWKEI